MQSSIIVDVAAVVPDEAIKALMDAAKGGGFDGCQRQVMDLVADGWPAQQVSPPL